MEKTITITKKEFTEISKSLLEELSKDYESVSTGDESHDKMSNLMFILQNTLVISKLGDKLFKDEKEPTK